MLETIHLEHIPHTLSIHVAFYRNVTNASFLHSQLLARNASFEYALIDASTVISRFHLLAAVYKSITVELGGNMKTPNIHSEIVCALSSNNNIAEAYRRYGISPISKDVLVVKVLNTAHANTSDLTKESTETHLNEHVKGESVEFSDEEIAKTTDWSKLRKYHKLNGAAGLDDITDMDAKRKEMEMMIVSAMALRGL
ncbi:uncharacterized protein BCR38DRAFT_356316 [Pseudomassariella vexata]|uniref:EKC/KEOPS complex subunit CGI121 n=1 Tax=Pseudomassariella vexata TaxID=1141098 RepID=A0A1Y2D9I4_9PEZI|nr:uncharacterized protein BCR38DRAFT_356316 [Pseudomassariella vexata]ORY55923.1 hypothetical protein BCR38DRAFT_356316 [Pseudomassariella vexata]